MRDLRTAGATDASFVVQAAILVAKGHPIPALDVLPQTAVADWLEAPRRLVAATASQQLGRHRDVEALLAPLRRDAANSPTRPSVSCITALPNHADSRTG